jgi:hypothetical protein
MERNEVKMHRAYRVGKEKSKGSEIESNFSVPFFKLTTQILTLIPEQAANALSFSFIISLAKSTL